VLPRGKLRRALAQYYQKTAQAYRTVRHLLGKGDSPPGGAGPC